MEKKQKEQQEPKKSGTDQVTDTQDMISLINSKLKKSNVARECKIDVIKHIPTGIYKIDGMIGGGIPVGNASLFWGNPGSAKTTSCMRVIGEANKRCALCLDLLEECKCKKTKEFVTAYFAAEDITFTNWSKNLGISEDRLVPVYPNTAEECCDVYLDIVRSGKVDLVILDSIAALIPEAEAAGTMSDMQQGAQARVLGKFHRKLYSAIVDNKRQFGRTATMLFVNQTRQKIGVMFGSNEIKPGGMAIGFATALEIKFYAKEKPESIKDELFESKPIIIDISFLINKRRYGASKAEGAYKLCLRENAGKMPGEIADEKALITDAFYMGLLKKDGKMQKFGEYDLGTKGEDAVDFLIKNKDVAKALRRAVVEVMINL